MVYKFCLRPQKKQRSRTIAAYSSFYFPFQHVQARVSKCSVRSTVMQLWIYVLTVLKMLSCLCQTNKFMHIYKFYHSCHVFLKFFLQPFTALFPIFLLKVVILKSALCLCSQMHAFNHPPHPTLPAHISLF